MAAPGSLLDSQEQASSVSPLNVGEIVCGKYRIERQIGRGGMGVVLAATHLQLESLVAIKVMRRDLVEDDRALDRLLVEARAAARIRSEHVARVLDVGMLDNGSPFIVMEYLEGENLADLLDRQGTLEVEHAALFMLQCCLALAEVHVAEMVHRDLKPGNIFIARLPDGSSVVKIVDFGISKQIGVGAPERAATTSPQVLGSPYYMSPEQMRAEPVDVRSDIWGLGAILFEMLTGRPPFLGDTLPEVYSAVLNDAPPPLEALRPSVPAGMDDVVRRCLEKAPAQRFCDVAELAEAVAPHVAGGAQWVERITRILTNPDAVRLRPSSPSSPLPRAAAFRAQTPAAKAGGVVAGGVVAGGVVAGNVGVSGTSSAPGGARLELQDMEGTMTGGHGGRSGAGREAPQTSAGDERPGRTLLESGPLLHDGAARGEERASGPSAFERVSLSATGADGARGARGVVKGWMWVALGAAAALAVAALLWPAAEPVAPAPVPAVAAPARSEPALGTAEQRAAEPRVTPIVELPAAEPKERGDQTQTRALQPAPRPPQAPPGPATTGDSVPPVRAAAAPADERRPAAAGEALVPPATPRRDEPEGALVSDEFDPWDPDSFGDRR